MKKTLLLLISIVFVSFKVSAEEKPSIKEDTNKNLNITYEKIKEKNYYSSSIIEIIKDKPIKITIKAGSSIKANEVDIILKNIHGQVNFKSEIKNIINKIDNKSKNNN